MHFTVLIIYDQIDERFLPVNTCMALSFLLQLQELTAIVQFQKRPDLLRTARARHGVTAQLCLFFPRHKFWNALHPKHAAFRRGDSKPVKIKDQCPDWPPASAA